MTETRAFDDQLRSHGIEHATVIRKDSIGPSRPRARVRQGGRIARALLLADDRGYALAVIPGGRCVDLAAIEREFGRQLRLARTDEVARLFPGDLPKILPPVASGLQLETFVDQALVPLSEVYFETADPERLAQIDGETFRALLYNAWCGHISRMEN